MICKECKDKPIVRGIKHIKCFKCGKEAIVNSAYNNICNDCSGTYVICQYCGKEIKPDSENH
jgi:ribosomal protein S27E